MHRIIITLTFISSLLQRYNSWHVYNETYINNNPKCLNYSEATKPYTKEFIERLSLWPNLMSSTDELFGETIYNSKEALELIHKNQNPDNCSTAKYLISGGWPYGFGVSITIIYLHRIISYDITSFMLIYIMYLFC